MMRSFDIQLGNQNRKMKNVFVILFVMIPKNNQLCVFSYFDFMLRSKKEK